MIAKGHDIPNVTLVGVVSADVGLGMPDFRAAERTFQLLTQAAGRAGRGNLPGIVLIQTINPDHYAVRFAAAQDYAGLLRKGDPVPQADALSAFQRAGERAGAQPEAGGRPRHERRTRSASLDPPPEGLKVLGPAEAPVAKLKTEYRYQVLIKAASRKRLNEMLQQVRRFAHWKRSGARPRSVIDVDPLTLL